MVIYKIYSYIKNGLFSAIMIALIANLVFGNVVFAKKFDITEKDIRTIKEVLNFANIFSNIAVTDDKIKTILNTTIDTGETSVDVSYGLLVLSVLDEVDLVDMVVSQRYKMYAREYFDHILGERLNLFSYWKNVGLELPRVFWGNITGPMSALSLSSFSITSKAIDIFLAFENLKAIKFYDGLWYYFDLRANGHEPHNIAWEETEIEIGWAIKEEWGFSRQNNREKEVRDLELKFSSLWDKWGPYITPYGISEEVKGQVRSELSNTLSGAVENYNFAGVQPKPSFTFFDNLLNNLAQKVDDLKSLAENSLLLGGDIIRRSIEEILASLSQINLLGAVVPVPSLPPSGSADNKQAIEESVNSQEVIGNGMTDNKIIIGQQNQLVTESTIDSRQRYIDEIQEKIDEITEKIDILEQEASQFTRNDQNLIEETVSLAEELLAEKKLQEAEESLLESGLVSNLENTAPIVELCQLPADNLYTSNRVILNEVAWMGTSESSSNEWIELKNISPMEVNISGWQILNKEKKIKGVLKENTVLPPNSFFLLERTDDNSVPGMTADFIYTGALKDNDEALYLFNERCEVQDGVLANSNWPAGDKGLRKSMERSNDLTWHTHNGSYFGTPKTENSPSFVLLSSGTVALPVKEIAYSAPNILITEVQIDTASSSNYDFIELYNPNDSVVDISNFQLKKKTSTGSEYSVRVLPSGTIVAEKSYFLWANSDYSLSGFISANVTSTQTLAQNNSIVLLDKNENIIDALAWGSSTNPFVESSAFPQNPAENQSLSRKWSTTTESYIDTNNNLNDFEIQKSTPGIQNQINSNDSEENSEGSMVEMDIVINEIAWMGTQGNAQDEWIELYNNTSSSSIDLTGWTLKSTDEDLLIIFSTSTAATTTISANGYYLLERTDNSATSENAGWFGSFGYGLNNSGERLELLDPEGKLIDKVDCQRTAAGECQSWFAGSGSPNYISMERINSMESGANVDNWASNNRVSKNGKDAGNNEINGTPGAQNSVSKSSTSFSGLLTISDDFTLTYLGSPYLITGSINVLAGAKLTIEPGVIIKLKNHSSYGSEINIDGSLEALGEDDRRIIITSFYDDEYGGDTNNDSTNTVPVPGNWDWLYFKNSQSKLENIVMRYGGRLHGGTPSFTYGMVYVDGGKVQINKSVIENSPTYGIWVRNSSDSLINEVEFNNIDSDYYWQDSSAVALYIENEGPTISDSIFRNDKAGIFADNFSSPIIENNYFERNQKPIKINTILPIILGNTVENNNYNGIILSSLSLPDGQDSAIWRNTNLPYIVERVTIKSGKIIEVEPGVIIKFLSGDGRIDVKGNLSAKGIVENKIIFTSIYDDEYGGDTDNNGAATEPAAGHWDNIHFYASSTDSLLNNVMIRYGGWQNTFLGGQFAKGGAIKVENADITIQGSVIENNMYAGVELIDSTATIENTIFRYQNASYNYGGGYSAGLLLKNSQINASSITFENNYYGIFIEIGDCTDLSGMIFGEREMANNYNIYPEFCE